MRPKGHWDFTGTEFGDLPWHQRWNTPALRRFHLVVLAKFILQEFGWSCHRIWSFCFLSKKDVNYYKEKLLWLSRTFWTLLSFLLGLGCKVFGRPVFVQCPQPSVTKRCWFFLLEVTWRQILSATKNTSVIVIGVTPLEIWVCISIGSHTLAQWIGNDSC